MYEKDHRRLVGLLDKRFLSGGVAEAPALLLFLTLATFVLVRVKLHPPTTSTPSTVTPEQACHHPTLRLH